MNRDHAQEAYAAAYRQWLDAHRRYEQEWKADAPTNATLATLTEAERALRCASGTLAQSSKAERVAQQAQTSGRPQPNHAGRAALTVLVLTTTLAGILASIPRH